MKKLIWPLLILLAGCSKEVPLEAGQDKLTLTADLLVNGSPSVYTSFAFQTLTFPFTAINIPATNPVLRIETVSLNELDSVHTASQKVNFRYTLNNKTYVADNTRGDGYILCSRNRNSEINVNVRDASGNIRPALKRYEDLELKFRFRALNLAAPFDTLQVTGGKLVRNGYYYVY